MLFIANQNAYAWLPPKGKTQFFVQVYFCHLPKKLKFLMSKKPELENIYIRGKNLLYEIDKDNSLTVEQKIHKKEEVKRTILLPAAKFIKFIPDNYDSLFYINTIESRVNDLSSIGMKILSKRSMSITKDTIQVFETSLFNKVQIYSSKSKSLLLSPQITFAANHFVDGDLRLIYSKSSKFKKLTNLSRISQFQIGSGASLYGPKFILDYTVALKSQNNITLLLQEFCTLDIKNPLELYKRTIKSQISITKTFGKANTTFQLGYFVHTSLRPSLLLSSGVFGGMWHYF
jgi:hypothetical protein